MSRRRTDRPEMKKRSNERGRYRATFSRAGTKPGFQGADPLPTILLDDVKDAVTDEQITNHLWLNLTKGFAKLGTLNEGDVVEFDARVKSYTKGYHGYRQDVIRCSIHSHKLSHPTKISKIKI